MDRPNILLFLPDALKPETLHRDHPCLAPNMKRIADEGVSFCRAYTPSPTCSPARASLMTGLLPHNHGVLQVEHCVDSDQSVLRTDKPHWAQHLQALGYVTGYFGKWHIERTEKLENFGWETNKSWRTPEYRKAKADLPSVVEHLDPASCRYIQKADGYEPWLYYGVADLPVSSLPVSLPVDFAEPWLDSVLQQNRPWCCCVSFSEPNEQLTASRETVEKYGSAVLDLPVHLRDEMQNVPGLYRRIQGIWNDLTDDEWRMARLCYYARVTEIDQQLGRILRKLEVADALENTILIISADHGRYLGAHGMDAHNFGAYEDIYRIPMIIRGPGIARGMVSDERVGLHDLCPTLLELTGAEPIPVPDSRSFAGLLRNPIGKHEPRLGFAEYHGARYPLAQRILYDGDWKYVFNGFDFDELYHLSEDPGECRNLAGNPECRERIRQMMSGMWEIMKLTYDKPLVESHYYSMQFAPVGPGRSESNPNPLH